jgi:hypothetical protein
MQKKYLYLFPILLFGILTAFFFQPSVLGNKTLYQNDKIQWRGGASEVMDFRESDNIEPLWTNSMFSGMPAYLISTIHYGEIHKAPIKFLNFFFRSPALYMFIGMVCFYFLMLTFNANPIIATIGAVAFSLTSFTIVSMEAGHNSKVLAMNLMPLVLAGMNLAFRKKYLLGLAISAFAAALLVGSGHFQVAYYTFLIALIFFIFKVYPLIKQKDWKTIFLICALFGLVGILGLGPNLGKLLTVQEYSRYSNRSPSELVKDDVQTKEKDRDYAFAWSYGNMETLTLLIPNASGGGSASEYPYKSLETYDLLKGNYGRKTAEQYVSSLMYWGPLPSTAGPVYFGSIIVFLFILSLAYLPKRTSWFLGLTATLGIVLCWGKNFGFINDLLFDFLPGYNKFRTPMMALSISQFIFPLGATLFLSHVANQKDPAAFLNQKKFWRLAGGFFGFLILVFLLSQGFSFTGGGQDDSISQNSPQLLTAMIENRKGLFMKDWTRTIFLSTAAAVALLLFMWKKINLNSTLAVLGLLILGDLWTVDKRYLKSDNFVKEELKEQFNKTAADELILRDKDPNYRVLNLAANTFNDATTSFWHKSIGGYHGAKMRRYQDLIERHIGRGNQDVLNMLNTRYVITRDKENPVQRNPGALGNSWFIEKIITVDGPDAEMAALGDFDPANEAILDVSKFNLNGNEFSKNNNASISLSSYKPNKLIYKSNNNSDGFAVFSEVYYPEGWKAKIDEKEASIVRVNWVLRGLEIPAGDHTIEFSFESSSYERGNKLALASSILLYLLLAGAFFMEVRNKNNHVKKDSGTGATS